MGREAELGDERLGRNDQEDAEDERQESSLAGGRQVAGEIAVERLDLIDDGSDGGAGIGLVGAACGVAIAAWTIPRLGMMPSLWLFGLLQALSNLGYVGLDQHWWGGLPGLIGVLLVENLCGALAATAFVAFLMGFCTSVSAATQYAVLTTLALLGPQLLRQPVADLIPTLGWSGFFAMTTAMVIPILVLLAMMLDRPIVTVNFNQVPHFDYYESVGGTLHARSPEDAASALKRALFDGPTRAELAEQRSRVLARYARFDGQATNRLADLVEELAR